MKVEKTVKSEVIQPTNIKHKQLTQMWENYQHWLKTKDDNIDVYSAHKQQAKRNLKIDKIKDDREYPLFIRKDLLSIQKCDSDLADYFFKIPSIYWNLFTNSIEYQNCFTILMLKEYLPSSLGIFYRKFQVSSNF